MTSTLVELHRYDDSETFTLKASRVDPEVANDVFTTSIISAASNQILGGKFVGEIVTYKIDFQIQGMEAADYPNDGNYTDDDYGYREELWRASLEWGPVLDQDGIPQFDTLEYDGRSIDGVVTLFNPVEDSDQRLTGTYDATLEWTHIDAYVA